MRLPNQRINLIADANLETQRARYGVCLFYFGFICPASSFHTEGRINLVGFIFMLVFYAQIFIIGLLVIMQKSSRYNSIN